MSEQATREPAVILPGRSVSGQVLVIIGLLTAVTALALAPYYVSSYNITLLGTFFAYAIALLGFNILFGYTGLLSFGHAMFLAIGAYTAAALTSKFGIKSFELILLSAVGVALVSGLLIGMLCVRYNKIFFGMLTLAFGMTFHSFLFKFYSVTGGDQGMRVLRPQLLGMDFAGGKTAFLIGPFYYYALVLLIIFAVIAWRLVNSPLGLHLRSIRENSEKAAYLGVQVYRLKLVAFVISAIYCSVAGALLSVTTGLADPELGYWTHSGNLVFMTVLGGSAAFAGPIFGSLVFVFLSDALMAATEYWRFVLGAILVLLVLFFPRGLIGILDDLRRYAVKS